MVNKPHVVFIGKPGGDQFDGKYPFRAGVLFPSDTPPSALAHYLKQDGFKETELVQTDKGPAFLLKKQKNADDLHREVSRVLGRDRVVYDIKKRVFLLD